MRLSISLVLMGVSTCALAQLEEQLDSLAVAAEQDEIVLLADTVAPNFTPLPSEVEFVPADATSELLADRLSCLQQTIPLSYNDKVHAFINYFVVRDREYTRMILRKKDIYFPIFERHLKQHNLPEELKYLAIIESGLYPRAVSRARAVGLWQFMAATGRYFGLKIDWYVDERMDPEKSTEAACKYLIQLHTIFKDWELALAAYNSGPGTVRRAIRRSGYKKSFWEIYRYLPRETRAYVPQYVAIIYALNYAEHHNIHETAIERVMRYDTLHVNKFLNLKTFSKLTGACPEDLQRLNPSIQHEAIPGNGKLHVVKIPLEAKTELQANRLAILDSATKTGRKETEVLAKNAAGNTLGREMITYRVRSGDAISVIAEKYRVRTTDIRSWNNLLSNTIRAGQNLKIWVLPNQLASVNKPKPVQPQQAVALPPDSKTYTVQPGDTLWDISRKFQGLTIEKIKTLNNLKTNKLQPGQKLIIS